MTMKTVYELDNIYHTRQRILIGFNGQIIYGRMGHFFVNRLIVMLILGGDVYHAPPKHERHKASMIGDACNSNYQNGDGRG